MDNLNNLLNFQPINYSIEQIILNIVLAFVLCFLVAWVYKLTHKGLSYSQSFIFTLIMLGVIASVVMMIIGNSIARAFGFLGAFSIIRFRTVVKDTKDTAFVFFVLAIGMAIGTQNYLLAVISTLLILLIVYLLTRINFGTIKKNDYILSFTLDTNMAQEDSYQHVLKEFLTSYNLLNIKAKGEGKVLDIVFGVKFKKDNIDQFLQKLESLPGLETVNLLNSKNDIEY